MNYKSRQSSNYKLIETYKATGAEASKTFTFTAKDFDTTSELQLILDGETTAALVLQITINGSTNSKYRYTGSQIIGTTETLVNATADAALQICPTAIINAVRQFFGVIHIGLTTGGSNFPQIHGHMASISRYYDFSADLNEAHTNISSIEVITSTSTWKIGTRLSLYEVTR